MLPPFGLSAVLTQWQFAPIVTGFAVIAVGLYGWGVIRVARRHPARPWPAWRTCMFVAGLAVIVLATQSGIGAYDDVLFYDHMVQHLMLLMVAPPLLIAGPAAHAAAARQPEPAAHLDQAGPPVAGRELPDLAGVRRGRLRARGARRAPDRDRELRRAEPDRAQRRARAVRAHRLPVLPADPRPRADPLAAVLPGPVRDPGAAHAGGHLHRPRARLRQRELARRADRPAAGLGAEPGRPTCIWAAR